MSDTLPCPPPNPLPELRGDLADLVSRLTDYDPPPYSSKFGARGGVVWIRNVALAHLQAAEHELASLENCLNNDPGYHHAQLSE